MSWTAPAAGTGCSLVGYDLYSGTSLVAQTSGTSTQHRVLRPWVGGRGRHELSYKKEQGLGGAFFWELSGDTSNGALLNALYDNR
ncbi:hypothetical protein [Hyalangium gracile]|uniref:hypothetical protein n=1 Tax=Hyalangium gracile TaxID=394092 RepID=UPI001CCDE2F6|nr:hypothetical protein [Hyalangium gracile]